MLSIYLNLPYTELDSIINAWDQIKTDFENKSTITLEEQLFYKASFIMEVDQNMISVEIYDYYDLSKYSTFERVIYFENGQIRLQENNPKYSRKSFTLQPTDLSNNKEESTVEFQQRFSKNKVYERILGYAKERFGWGFVSVPTWEKINA